jgi:phage baseplate assembly protein gpV
MISENTYLGDQARLFEQVITGREAMMWTALPGIIQSFDAEALTCTVQPAIQGRRLKEDGTVEAENLPLLVDCPVVFPHAGGGSLTFPIAEGDECLVVFSSRAIDFWWQSGGIQPPAEPRMHDLSDGFVIPGIWSQATKIGSVSTTCVELRTDDRAAYISFNPSSHEVQIETSGDAILTVGGTMTATVSGDVKLTCPTLTIDCPETTFTGHVAINGGLSSTGGSGAAAVINGSLTATGDVTAGSISLQSHTHPGDSGGTTGAAQ